ncbi:YcgN family cysteine cluster protein, partial [bacterium]|nr:YcgN family cysteine cluster protein [bacterium]
MFWHGRDLESFTALEWESLCDACGKCCLHKLHDEDNDTVAYTRIACRQLDVEHVRCRDYQNRLQRNPECIRVTPDMARADNLLPSTCSYRLVAQGLPLPSWHPLLTGDKDSAPAFGESVRGI